MQSGSPTLGNKYALLDKIGEGMFGQVYRGQNTRSKEVVAIKMENNAGAYRLLKRETTILKYLYDNGCRKIPLVYWFGIWNNKTACIMTFFECSLHEYINVPLPTEKTNLIMLQCIHILESIHKQYVLHRDIKPHNFMIRDGELYIIDFGLAVFYVNDNIEVEENRDEKDANITGSPKYASYNIHMGEKSSRRDDLISLGYMYMYLCQRQLPWDIVSNVDVETQRDKCTGYCGADSDNEQSIQGYKNMQRGEMKSWGNLEPILLKINQKIHKFLNYCYNLQYKGEPNYAGLVQLFSE